jgi:protein disulfide-isomerase
MNKKSLLMVTILFLGLLNSLYANEEWLTDFQKAQELSKEKGVPILADFSGSDWCGWCIRLDQEVFSQPDFKKYADENLILFLADFPMKKEQTALLKKQNKTLSDKYEIKGYPTVLLLDSNGNVLLKTGYRRGGAKSYVDYLKSNLDTIINKSDTVKNK